MKKVTSSFVAGAVALVFAVLGYQTALVVHYSAVNKIVANRDRPDTVFIEAPGREYDAGNGQGTVRSAGMSTASDKGKGAASGKASGKGTGTGKASGKATRKNAEHSPQAQKIRQSVPVRTVEEFNFDPNTVSVEDMMRLGFSAKQAQSIENYRLKGGRYRRKSDFARSFVVSEENYTRLEPYIDIPRLDINTADSSAFDSLPGIGPYFASKMVKYRKQLHGYSYPEQLMDIHNFDKDKYDALSDLIYAGPSPEYPLWDLPEDSLKLHPYINSAHTARSIVFFRQHNKPRDCTIDALEQAGILKAGNAAKLRRCKILPPCEQEDKVQPNSGALLK